MLAQSPQSTQMDSSLSYFPFTEERDRAALFPPVLFALAIEPLAIY